MSELSELQRQGSCLLVAVYRPLRVLVRRWSCLLLCATLVACTSHTGGARDASAAQLREQGWRRVPSVPVVLAEGERDCGAAALASVLAHHGIQRSPEQVRDGVGRESNMGLSASEMRDYARGLGLRAFVIQGNEQDLQHEIAEGRPVVVGVVKPQSEGRGLAHYEVVVGHHQADGRVLTMDPARGLRINTRDGFEKEWNDSGRVTLVVLSAETQLQSLALP